MSRKFKTLNNLMDKGFYSRTQDCGIHTFFSEITHVFRPMCDIPALNLNVVHLLFEGQCLPSLKSKKVDTHIPVSS